jgi:hypothetical protein
VSAAIGKTNRRVMMTVAGIQFDSMADLWQDRYREARGGGSDVPDVRNTEDFMLKKNESNSVFERLKPLGESFVGLVKGLSPGVTGPERVVRAVLCFFPKFLRAQCISDLPNHKAKQLSFVIDQTFFLGLASHLILFNHPSRHLISGLDTNRVYPKFLEASGKADVVMRPYSKDLHGLPEDIFQAHFTSQVEPLMKRDFFIGFWKMGKVRSHFRNLFFAGTILGVLADTQASGYQ